MENTDLLLCDICMENFDDTHQPKMLACHHSFCEQCLQCVAGDQEKIECPNCRQVTSLPNGGIAGLQTNFYITFIRETLIKLGAPKVRGCVRHSNQPLSFFCQDCATAICRDCTVLDHNHGKHHHIVDVSTAEEEQRTTLSNEKKAAEAALTRVQDAVEHLKAELGNLDASRDAAQADIAAAFNRYSKNLEARKLQLKMQISKAYAERQASLKDKLEKLSASVTVLTDHVEQCEGITSTVPLPDVVDISKRLKECSQRTETEVSSLNVGKNYIRVLAEENMQQYRKAVESLGRVVLGDFLPSRVEFIPQGQLIASLHTTLLMKVFSFGGTELSNCDLKVKVTDQNKEPLSAAVTKTTDGESQVTFTPTMAGDCCIQPFFLDQPISGAFLQVAVSSNDPIKTFGSEGQGQGYFFCPRAVQVHKNGDLFIADTGNRVMQRLDSTGKFLSEFRIDGGNAEYSTCDVALNSELDMVVCIETAMGSSNTPTSGNTTAIYSTMGTLIRRFSSKVLKCSLCVAVNSHGEIIVSDYLLHSLFMYDSQGTFLRQIGQPTSFSHPAFICIGANDAIIVSDTNNSCVQVFDRQGSLLHRFGEPGSGRGQLKQPFGVASDGECIIVVDSGNHRLQVFKYNGSFVSTIESQGDPFNQPRGIALTDDGHVYVADRDNHVIKKYKYK